MVLVPSLRPRTRADSVLTEIREISRTGLDFLGRVPIPTRGLACTRELSDSVSAAPAIPRQV